MNEPRARRMAESTRLPMLDRRRASAADAIDVGGVVIPSRGDAVVDIDGRSLRLTSLDRVLWPEAGFTKAELVAYMLAVAPAMLPHLAERPLTVGRFPGGVDGRGFAQSELPGRPPWVRAESIRLAKGETRQFNIIEERAALVWLAQMGVIELHTFLGRWPDLAHPTSILFDLDPVEPAGLLEAAATALLLRDELEALGREAGAPFEIGVKTSGSVGVHVVVPAREGSTYPETRGFAAAVAARLAKRRPDLVSVTLRRSERAGKVLIDTRQNSERLTLVVPYSLRSTPRPTVSAPVSWTEVEHAVETRGRSALVFEAGAMLDRLAKTNDGREKDRDGRAPRGS